jgi:hypothetical protein
MIEKDKLDVMLDYVKDDEQFEPLRNDEKQRILDMTLCKIATEKRKPHWQRYLKAAVIILSVCLVGGSVAYAAFDLAPSLKNIFYSYNHEIKLDENTTAVGKSCKDKGVTVSVPEVVGDKYGVYILLKVKGVPNSSDYYYPGFEKAEVEIEGEKTYTCERPINEGLVDGVQDLVYHVNTQESLVGKKINLKLTNYGSYDEDMSDTYTTKIKGTWNMAWTLDYQDKSMTIPVNKTLPAFGGQVTIQEVNISPISATFVLKDETNLNKSYDSNAVENRIKVKFMDDSIVDSAFTELGNFSSNQRLVSINYNKAVDISEIESVSFAGLTIPVNENKNPIERRNFDVPELGFSIDMSKKLYNVISKTEKVTNKDDYFKCNVTSYSFTGKVENTELKMFSILVYDKVMTKEELEEVPMAYIGTKNGCTYLMHFAEDGTEEQVKYFGDLINDDVVKLAPWVKLQDIK